MKPHVPPELSIGAVLPSVDYPISGKVLPMVRSSSRTDPRIVLCVASHEEPRFDDTIPKPNLTPDPTPPANKLRNPAGTVLLDSPSAGGPPTFTPATDWVPRDLSLAAIFCAKVNLGELAVEPGVSNGTDMVNVLARDAPDEGAAHDRNGEKISWEWYLACQE
jgi:hypothetical protein